MRALYFSHNSVMMSFSKKRQSLMFIALASLLLAWFPAHAGASALTLAWDPNAEPDLAGYRIYYGTQSNVYESPINVGNVTYYTVRYLASETQYYFALTAYDIWGNESDFSDEVSAVTGDDPDPTVTIDSKEGGCFIATAAYGSYLNPHVQVLREFRDAFLIPNPLGRKLVHLYYRYAPCIANGLGNCGSLRFIVRQGLLPLIGMSSLSLKPANIPAFLFLPLCLLAILPLLIRFCPRRAR
jgi:hypothetical protein